jgi:hypothetical protein
MPLALASLLTAVEGVALVVVGLVEWLMTHTPRVSVPTGLFFVVAGLFIAYCAHRLWRLHSWARAPVVMLQLIQIGLGFSFWGTGVFKAVSAVLMLVAILVLVGIFHPQSLRALEDA